jgi:hypothetical protein
MTESKKNEDMSINESNVSRREWLRTGSMGMAAVFGSVFMGSCAQANPEKTESSNALRSIRDFGIVPTNPPDTNRALLQEAIDWASICGTALFVEPTEEPYPITAGLVLRRNTSLIGVHGPTPRGTRHPKKAQPVGSVFKIESDDKPFITVEASTQLRGLQFWYPAQTNSDPNKIIEYPPTVQCAQDQYVVGVTFSNLTCYGEFTTFDFRANVDADHEFPAELLLLEHCYGYPLGGRFIDINYYYDVPRVLHCHSNPAVRRTIDGDYQPRIIDSVVARKTFTYSVDHTDNAVLMDLFTFGAFGGIRLGPSCYGQLTNFNLDCVSIGIHKSGDNQYNRNWQIAQGSIIANTGPRTEDIHPIVIDGKGHTALTNVEAFTGMNPVISSPTVEVNGKKITLSQDFLLVEGNEQLTVTLTGCRMGNYYAENPITINNPNATVATFGCFKTRAHEHNPLPIENGYITHKT